MRLFRKISIQLVIYILVILQVRSIYAQGNANSPYIPGIIPPSPNAAALMKFTDVPVSLYTGTADITVPIYTIKTKSIQVPVNISYHTGGVKLKEEASSVGLGWALNAGGIISRTIMGHDDFGTQGDIYLTTSCPQLSGDISFNQPAQATNAPNLNANLLDFYCSYKVNTSSGTEDFTPAFGDGSDTYDMEPDIFSYSFPGHSGKFILTRAGKVVMQKQENIRIKFQGTGNLVTFTINDDQGNTFYFNVTELTAVSPKPSQISSWMLTKIITQQQDSILFNYTSGGSTTSSVDETYQTYGAFCAAMNNLTTSTVPTPAYFNQTLQSIDFNNGHLQFAFDAARADLQGGYKLDSVMIYSKNAAGVQTYLKQENFYYSYFNSTSTQTNLMEYYRLKLDSTKEKSGGITLPAYTFIYNNPEPGLLSAKHSFSADHWGYYNGASNSTFIPGMNIEYLPFISAVYPVPIFFQYPGANRKPSFPEMQTFSLQQITYPTGGKTLFTYQANDYDYANSVTNLDPLQYVQLVNMDSSITVTRHGLTSGTIDLTHIYPVITPSSPQTNVTVNVGFKYQSNGNTTYSDSTGKIYFTLGGNAWDIDGATCQANSPACGSSLTFAVNNGVYHWSAYIDPSIDTATIFSGIYITIQYQETLQDYNLLQNNSYISSASGLRVKNITNYKDANTVATQKVYSYTYQQDKTGTGHPQDYSNGRLMSIPSYARYAITSTGDGGYCTALVLFGSSLSSLTSVMQGNIVGYDKVMEYSVDPLTGQDVGKTVYTYFNSPDTAVTFSGYRLPGTLSIGNNLNGLLLSKINYSNNVGIYYKSDETDNYYHTTNRIIYYSPKYQYYQGVMSSSYCSTRSAVETQTAAWFYPSIKSERVLLDSTRTINYQQGDTTKAVKSTAANFYDNPSHYQVTRIRTIDSKGNIMFTHIKYPLDYVPNGSNLTGNAILDSMIGRNMTAPVIEKQDSLYYAGASTGSVSGAQLSFYRILPANSNTILPDKIYKLDLQSPVTNFQPFSFTGNSIRMDSRYRQMISFDKYDQSNNIQQYTSTDQNPVTIIWDYTNTYPIAQVKNASTADVAATSFEADGKGGWSFTGTPITDTSTPTGSKCYPMSGGNITKSGLSNSTQYVLSFWAKTGSSLGITGGTYTGKTGKTINRWTYFEDIVSGAISITLSGTGYVDELRLYPAKAQMNTYTYSPLLDMTTACDADNRVTYYFYDGLGRLKWVKDQDGNMMKTYQYHYQNLSTQY